MMSVAWGLIYKRRHVMSVAERVEGPWGTQVRTRIAWKLMTVGEDVSAHGERLESAVERWARALRIPMDDVLRPLMQQ